MLCSAVILLSGGCTPEGKKALAELLNVAKDGKVNVQVVIPANAGTGLQHAAEDLSEAFAKITGATASSVIKGAVSNAKTDHVIVVTPNESNAAKTGEQGHFIEYKWLEGDSKAGLHVTAANEAAGMWGLYRIAWDIGARYIHPEESFFPSNPTLKLPLYPGAKVEKPRFSVRGLHEHTQHPTPASDFLLRQDDPKFRKMASRYVRWLARNRQNTFTFHMLKTVPLAKWVPYYKGIVDEARDHGIEAGFVVSFADQQQNNFKLILESRKDGGGNVLADDKQIRIGLDEVLKTGVRRITFQIGTSEFTKPEDARVMKWLDVAVDHLGSQKPPVKPYAWIHTTCSLHDDKGGYFYHLPLKAKKELGAWVHTTMFYDLDHPAPVYDCKDFSAKQDFMKAASGQGGTKREQVYFPETAWWLGFDNNMPLALPITGWSRAHDITKVLPKYDVTGHITFTTGREWGYWLYDHYVMTAAWDGAGWQDYLDAMKHFGGRASGPGGDLTDVLYKWSELQAKHYYEDNPDIVFYLAGELAQDEIGEQAGILARRPKLAFPKVLKMDNKAFAAWKKKDFDMLATMHTAYQALLGSIPASLSDGTAQQKRLFNEMRRGLQIYVLRIEHTQLLYGAVAAMRPWHKAVQLSRQASPVVAPDENIKNNAKKTAKALIEKANGITAKVMELIAAQEKDYRYPAAILSEKKPKTLTSYPFGYLEQTHTGHFWHRRDKQAQVLADKTFGDFKESWKDKPKQLFFTNKDKTKLTKPAHPTASGVLSNFMPRLLWGFSTVTKDGSTTLRVGQDGNANNVPDGETEQSIPCKVDAKGGSGGALTFTGFSKSFSIVIEDSSGTPQGTLSMLDAGFSGLVKVEKGEVTSLDGASVVGNVGSKALLDILFAVGGIDERGASSLLKAVFGIKPGQPLPKLLPFEFAFGFEPVKK